MTGVVLAGRLLLAGVFAVSGAAKLVDRNGSREAARSFGAPERPARALAVVLPILELALAALLLPAGSARVGAVGALALLVLFAAVIAVALARGRAPECHCFGQLHSSRAGAGTLARDLALAGVAAFVAIAGERHPGPSAVGWVGHLSAGGAAGVALGLVLGGVLAFQGWFSWQLLRQNGRLLERLEAIERRLGEPSEDASGLASPNGQSAWSPEAGTGRGGAGMPGLPVGSPAPRFVVPSLEGPARSLDAVLAAGKPALLVFGDAGCGPCTALLPEVAAWQREHQQLSVVLVSRGAVEVIRAKTAEYGLRGVLVQRDREVAESYLAYGTPSAVLVSSEGRIASPLAGGADAIRRLLDDALRRSALVVRAVPGAGGTDGGARAAPGRPGAANGRPPPPLKAPAVGQPAQDFALTDLAGRTLGLSDLRGRRVLLVFWNPGCGFCQRMLPDLRAWEATHAETAPVLVLVSTGSVPANTEMGLASPVLLDPDGTTMRGFGAAGTPMAVMVDESGRVASELMVGADAVMAAARGDPAAIAAGS